MNPLRTAVRSSPWAASARLLRFNVLARAGAHQNLRALVQEPGWRAALQASVGGKRVLIATNLGGHFGLAAIDRMLAIALTLRGANTTTMLCDRALPACQMDELALAPALAKRGQPALLCSYCYAPAANAVRALGLPIATLDFFVGAELRAEARSLAAATDIARINGFSWRGLPVGEHALSGALRYAARAELQGERDRDLLARRYLEASIIAGGAYLKALETLEPEVLIAHHGIYVPQGLAVAAARSRGVRVVTWNPAYRRHCFIFSHNETYHHTLMQEPTERWRYGPFDDAARARTVRYLRGRRDGLDDWIRFHPPTDKKGGEPLPRTANESGRPMILALTNVFWDAQLHYPSNGFASQREWLIETVRWFASRPDLHLVVRAHPAEINGAPPSRQRAIDEIRSAFPKAPENVTLIGPDSGESTYALAERANAVLIYATKMGVELSAIGVPVIVAGEAWVRNKGFTTDVTDLDGYREALARLPLQRGLEANQQELALRYAHHFFFRRMLELPFVERDRIGGGFSVQVSSLDALRPKANHGLDVICDGILNGEPFEF